MTLACISSGLTHKCFLILSEYSLLVGIWTTETSSLKDILLCVAEDMLVDKLLSSDMDWQELAEDVDANEGLSLVVPMKIAGLAKMIPRAEKNVSLEQL